MNHTVEPVVPCIKAACEGILQSIDAQIVCESHRHSLFSGRSTAAAGTVFKLYWNQDAVSHAHTLTGSDLCTTLRLALR